jgi:hypothetical protein
VERECASYHETICAKRENLLPEFAHLYSNPDISFNYNHVKKEVINQTIRVMYTAPSDAMRPRYARWEKAKLPVWNIIDSVLYHTFRYRDSRNRRNPKARNHDHGREENEDGPCHRTERAATMESTCSGRESSIAGGPPSATSQAGSSRFYDTVRDDWIPLPPPE